MAGIAGSLVIWHDGYVRPVVLVISHASVLAANQSVYTELSEDYDLRLVVPARWRNDYHAGDFGFSVQAGSQATFLPVSVFFRGRAQRHLHQCAAWRVIRRQGASVLVIEEEAFSLAGAYWALSASFQGIPFAIQAAENLERPLPRLVRAVERRVLRRAGLVMARSPKAAERAIAHGARKECVEVVAHGVDGVSTHEAKGRRGVVGYVGRLSEAKGLRDAVSAVDEAGLVLEVVGDGELREFLDHCGPRVRTLGPMEPEKVLDFYASVSALLVPSRTTPTWSEQFGRVIIESLAQGTPVVAYDSGEIPWVASETGISLVPEGDVSGLARELLRLQDPEVARHEGQRGREAVSRRFTNHVAAEQIRRFIEKSVSRGS